MNSRCWFVYIVRCADGSLYTGVSNDVERRVISHNAKKGAKYTRGRTPVSLVYVEKIEGKGMALKRELELKDFSRREKEELIARCGPRS